MPISPEKIEKNETPASSTFAVDHQRTLSCFENISMMVGNTPLVKLS